MDRRVSDRGFGSGRTFGDGGSDAGGERRDRRDQYNQDDGKVRDFGNWERKGPLSPLPMQERQTSAREGGRPRTNDGPRNDSFKDRRTSPAAWGEGRPQGSQDGSRPPRRDFQERPIPERAPTAAEQDNQWRKNMKPDAPVPVTRSPVPSRDGSEAPSSPAVATAPVSRPKLNLAKRTVSEATDIASPSSSDAKASPFGAARPIDTAAKEKEIEEKRLREKKEAEEKAREEKRLAKEAAKADKAGADGESENGTATPDGSKKVEILQRQGADDSKNNQTTKEDSNGTTSEDKAAKPKDAPKDGRLKPSESGTWRRPSGGQKSPRNDMPPRGPRGEGAPRGPRGDGQRGPRTNGAPPTASPVQPSPVEQDATVPEEEGWSTVSKPKKNQRAGNQPARPIAS